MTTPPPVPRALRRGLRLVVRVTALPLARSLALSLALPLALAVAARPAVASDAGVGGRTPAVAARADTVGLERAIARARADSARRPYTEADVRFMQHMIGHHAQAVVMSRLAPERGASSAARILAERIINAQQDEIAIMQQWLRERRQAVPEAKPMPMRHRMPDGTEHEMLMPGMLSDAEMSALAAARGPEFDVLFLRSMIKHHRGATAMVKELFDTDGAGQDLTVFKFASDVNVDQTTEIQRMQKMLAAALFGPPAKDGAGPR